MERGGKEPTPVPYEHSIEYAAPVLLGLHLGGREEGKIPSLIP